MKRQLNNAPTRGTATYVPRAVANATTSRPRSANTHEHDAMIPIFTKLDGCPYAHRQIIVIGRDQPKTSVRQATSNQGELIALDLPVMPKPSMIAAAPATPTKRKLALLLPGHNEELIIAATIQSAVAAGQDLEDIYMVNDASTDKTAKIATSILGKQNVLSVHRSGKAVAVRKGIKKFDIENRYDWVHIADADSIFSRNYFRIYKSKLSDDYVVALGFVQSLRGNWISTYRAISYTYGQQIYRRVQSALGMVSVFPGPVTSFRTDILSQLDVNPNNVAEDFDMTLQVHRKNLGKILYIPKAVNYTQDPQTFHDFCKQSMRWYRGFFQGIQQHKIGLRRQRIDVGIGFQLLQTAVFLLQITVIFPFIMFETHDWMIAPAAIAIDFILTGIITIMSSVAIKRWNLLGAMPYFYFLRTAEIVMYFSAFVEVIVLKRLSSTVKGWSTEGRRYKIDSMAMKDIS